MNKIIEACRYLLINSPQAEECRNYLNSRISQEVQEEFKFGYFPKSEHLDLLSNLVDEKELLSLDLIYRRRVADTQSIKLLDTCFFENHPLILPYTDTYSNIIAIAGRTLTSETERKLLGFPKYKNTIFTKGKYLFNLNKAKSHILNKGFAIIVEGQFDTIKAVENGIYNIVAVGSSKLTAEQLALILRYTENIVLMFDNDEAGISGMETAIKKYSKYANIKKCILPAGYNDLDNYLKENTASSLSELI